MSALRFFAVVSIFGAVSAAWGILGGSIWVRTEMLDERLSDEIESLWGPETLVQTAPYWAAAAGVKDAADTIAPSASTITADIKHEHRYKGLLWYSTFTVDFAGTYTVAANDGEGAMEGFFIFNMPDGIISHDHLAITVDGTEVPLRCDQRESGKIAVPISRNRDHIVRVSFSTYGQDRWLYTPGRQKNFRKNGWRSSNGNSSKAAMSATTSYEAGDVKRRF